VTVFWQVWARPLLTVNGRHLISDVIRLCGGVNVFDRLSPLVPAVNLEAVVAANPEAIVTTRTDASVNQEEGLADWRALTHLRATRNHNLIVLDADTIHRQSPRILDGADALCERLEDVRARRPR
jgi:iron complex transport system substrate-binding protein